MLLLCLSNQFVEKLFYCLCVCIVSVIFLHEYASSMVILLKISFSGQVEQHQLILSL